jgi:CubicO group peptidase (beta-lactamase class C family)
MDAEELKRAAGLYERAVARDEVRGAVLLVARRGTIVLHEAIGWRDREREEPMQKDTLFHVASNTKAVIATAVLMLAEEGKLDLDAPIGRYLPAFANARSREITVRHLLTHTSGLRIPTIFLEPLLSKSAEHPDAPSLQAEVGRFAAIGPEAKPGTTYSYSNPGYNILGALIEVVAKQPLEQFLAARIYQPLGMTDTCHQDRAEILSRRAVIYNREQETWKAVYRPGDAAEYPFVRASGGMITTAGDYAKFLQLFLSGGTCRGKRLLKGESVRAATAPQTRSLYTPEELKRHSSFYGFGWQVSGDGICSHSGRHGTFAWVDPQHHVFGIVFTQSVGGDNPEEEFMKLVRQSVR